MKNFMNRRVRIHISLLTVLAFGGTSILPATAAAQISQLEPDTQVQPDFSATAGNLMERQSVQEMAIDQAAFLNAGPVSEASPSIIYYGFTSAEELEGRRITDNPRALSRLFENLGVTSPVPALQDGQVAVAVWDSAANLKLSAQKNDEGKWQVTAVHSATSAKADRNLAVLILPAGPVARIKHEYKEEVAPNAAPAAKDVSLVLEEDRSVQIVLSASDADGDALSFQITYSPSHGTLGPVVTDAQGIASVTYTPFSDYSGTDFFRYTANDGTKTSPPATADLLINPVDDAPVWDPQAVTDLEVDHLDPVITDLLPLVIDTDGGTPVFTAENLPSFARLEGDKLIFEHQTANDNGIYEFKIFVNGAAKTFSVVCRCTQHAHPTDTSHEHGMTGNVVNVHGQAMTMSETTALAIQSGSWFDAAIWEGGIVPLEGAVVEIPEGIMIHYDRMSDVAIDAIKVWGHLRFETGRNTRLLVGTLVVSQTGTLEIGSETDPIRSGVTAEVVFTDRAIDTVKDPYQLGHGLIGFGTVRIHGAAMPETFIRLAREPMAGDTTLVLSQVPVGWKAGDRLVVPDSRQLKPEETEANYVSHRDELVIDKIEGVVIHLVSAVKFDHPGGRDGDGNLDPEFLPHVANLTRNVVLRSENPAGTRGHTLFNYRADVDIRCADFRDLGRTTSDPLDSAKVNADGSVTAGTNQIGRYAVHLHHLWGRENPDDTGYQFRLTGNTVEYSEKWAVAVHGSHFGLISQNVGFRATSDVFVTEDGSEYGNVFERNFSIAAAQSDTPARSKHMAVAHGGYHSGFWLQGASNYIIGNVAAESLDVGYHVPVALSRFVKLKFPKFRGADMRDNAQVRIVELGNTSHLEFSGNEAYGATLEGIEDWGICQKGTEAVCTYKDSKFFNIHGAGITFYYTSGKHLIDGFEMRGTPGNGTLNDPAKGFAWVNGSNEVTVRRADIQGLDVGLAQMIDSTEGFDPRFTVEDSFFKNYTNVRVTNEPFIGANARLTVFRNVRFELPTIPWYAPLRRGTLPPPANFSFRAAVRDGYDFTAIPNDHYSYNHNGTGVNYRFFFGEQDPRFEMPVSKFNEEGKPLIIGCPEGGLSNEACREKYGMMWGGEIAPGTYAQVDAARVLAESLGAAGALAYRVDANGNILQ